jgi:hypothetical protein
VFLLGEVAPPLVVRPQRRWDYALIQSLGSAWQTPAWKVRVNPVWDTVGEISTRRHDPDQCLPA